MLHLNAPMGLEHVYIRILFIDINWEVLVEMVLCCFMTPGLNEDIRCHVKIVWPYFLQTCKSADQTSGYT